MLSRRTNDNGHCSVNTSRGERVPEAPYIHTALYDNIVSMCNLPLLSHANVGKTSTNVEGSECNAKPSSHLRPPAEAGRRCVHNFKYHAHSNARVTTPSRVPTGLMAPSFPTPLGPDCCRERHFIFLRARPRRRSHIMPSDEPPSAQEGRSASSSAAAPPPDIPQQRMRRCDLRGPLNQR